jgi:hypothetical protein
MVLKEQFVTTEILEIFHQNVQNLRNKNVNLKILLHNNLSTIDVLSFTEHWVFEDYTICNNLPNLSLISKHHSKSRKYGCSGMYVCKYVLCMYNPIY